MTAVLLSCMNFVLRVFCLNMFAIIVTNGMNCALGKAWYFWRLFREHRLTLSLSPLRTRKENMTLIEAWKIRHNLGGESGRGHWAVWELSAVLNSCVRLWAGLDSWEGFGKNQDSFRDLEFQTHTLVNNILSIRKKSIIENDDSLEGERSHKKYPYDVCERHPEI